MIADKRWRKHTIREGIRERDGTALRQTVARQAGSFGCSGGNDLHDAAWRALPVWPIRRAGSHRRDVPANATCAMPLRWDRLPSHRGALLLWPAPSLRDQLRLAPQPAWGSREFV